MSREEISEKIRNTADGYKRTAEGFASVSKFYANPDEFAAQYIDCEKTSQLFGEIASRLGRVAELQYEAAKKYA